MITVESHGVVCRFVNVGVDLSNPGVVHGQLLRGVFYEQRFLDYIRSLQIRGVYVDVGAYVGTHSLYFARLCNAARVYAFEPLTSNFDRLSANLVLNGLNERVVPFKLALSDRKGQISLNFPPEFAGCPPWREADPAHRSTTRVRGGTRTPATGAHPLRPARSRRSNTRPVAS